MRCVHNKVTLMDQEAIKHLSSIQKLFRWIENLSISYWEKFLKVSMDWNCDNSCREKKIKRLDRQPSYRELSRSYWDCSKIVFSKKRKTQIWMQSSMLQNQRSKQHFKLSKSSLNKKNVKHIDPKHTHTHKISLTNFFISKTS